MATDPTVQTNLSQQITKYQKDIDPLRYYPIVSFGVAYSFRVR
jgi:ubiquinone biosynthesis protein Coq4